MTTPILAADHWATNAQLIADAAGLGYLAGHVLDPTYGKGNWWALWRPEKFTTHDLTIDGVDFRELPHSAGMFDAIAFDPPYVCPGGRETSTIKDMHAAYGMGATPRTPTELFLYNARGMAECRRVLKPGGVLLYKSKDYIWSGKLQAVTHWIINDADNARLELIDRFEHFGSPGPQPKTNRDGSPRRQLHARRNLSTLLVFRKIKENPDGN